MALTKVPAQMIADAQPWGGTYDGFNIRSAGFAGATSQGAAFSNNLYYDGTNWRYIATGEGSVIFQSSGQIAVYSAPSGTAGAVASITPKLNVEADGSVLVKSAAGLGYGTGSGGTVTQATSKGTGVTLNKPTGQIMMSAASLAASGVVSFFLTNSIIGQNDVVIVNVVGAASGLQNYQVWASTASGGAYILLRNISAGALAETVTLNYVVIKGANA